MRAGQAVVQAVVQAGVQREVGNQPRRAGQGQTVVKAVVQPRRARQGQAVVQVVVQQPRRARQVVAEATQVG
jgi:hypothetical protein